MSTSAASSVRSLASYRKPSATVVCALCGDNVIDGGPQVEHGLCQRCLPVALKGVMRLLAAQE